METHNIKYLENLSKNNCIIFAFGLLSYDYFFVNHYNSVKYMAEMDGRIIRNRYGIN